ncbi:Tripartite motif-containing protein 29 [Oryzias melastigma]|uniref:Tripartite motif-containing protein 29 n=1 Tax=Oryzias melastigma TaxID=30732 RepID=A0A834CK41_ORYME|nr:Tripartite motif-containing protein 29 [Oryzias melastigma]
MKQSSLLRIQQREKAVQELKEAILSLTRSARAAAEESDCVFTELIRSVELKRFEVRELIKAQEKSAIDEAEQLLDAIQKDISELKSNQAKLEQLCQTDEPVRFLQPHRRSPTDPGLSFGPMMTALSDFKGLMQEVCQGGFVSIYERVRDVTIVGSENPPVQSNTTVTGPTGSASQMETSVSAAAAAPRDLNQTSNNLNPFLPSGPAKPIFAFSPFGTKLSSGTRQRHIRRPHFRRR